MFSFKSTLFVSTTLIVGWVMPASAYDAPARARGTTTLNVKNYGAKGDGVANDTTAIQNAINALPTAGGTVYVPAGTYRIDAEKNIRLRSKMLFKMDPTTILKTIPNDSERSYVLAAIDVEDVEIAGGQIHGDRSTHLGTTGEWGHAIMVRAGRRVTIRDITVKNNWGDGISIGALTNDLADTTDDIYSDDVILDDVISTNNRRQGLSVGRSKNVKVYDSEFSYTNGTAPEYGIDIEPDPVGNYHATGVRVENCDIHHNTGGGILVYKKTYDVVIKGNRINYNPYGVYTVGASDGFIAANWIEHNKYQGVALRGTTDNYKVYANTLRNNHTAVYGVNDDNNPTTPIEGLLSGSSGTSPHIQVADTTTNITIGINYCAK